MLSRRAAAVEGRTIAFDLGWTEPGDVATVTYPQKSGVGPARTVSNAYSYGLLTGVSEGGTSFAPSITYHTNMTPNRITFGNGAWLDHAKDPYDMARPSRITLGNASSSWDTGVYGYDGAGNITTMAGASTDTFVYDRVSRIKEARVTVGGQVKTQSYTYDSFSNVKTITTNGSTRSLAVDTLTNRISGSGYDTAGSMTSWGDGATTYSYAYYQTGQAMQMMGDGRNNLYGYSAAGERVGMYDSVVGGTTYILRGLDAKPLRQYRDIGGVFTWLKDWVYRDGLLLATVEPSGTKYFHLDHLGTPRRITNSSRTVVASHDYYPFGEEVTGSTPDGEVLKFTGHERDLRDAAKTTDDLDYMHARYHNPNLARFLIVDPAGGDPAQPQSWNRYSYVGNNPIRIIDPDGEEWGDTNLFVETKQTAKAEDASFNEAAWGEGYQKGSVASAAAGLALLGGVGLVAAAPELATFGIAVMANPNTPQIANGVIEAFNPNPGSLVGVTAAGGLQVPKVTNSKLANLVDDLFKGAKGPNPIGTGSTADAVRNELATGLPTHGRFHSQKAQEYVRALRKWLARSPDATDYDKLVARSLVNDLDSALKGQ